MMSSVEAARRQMVDQQVRAWDVLDDRILDTLVAVPRERFVPPAFRDVAFADAEIPLGHGQVMLAPKVDGRILQAIAPLPNETVLEVGTGSGFLTACLARLAGQVVSIEIHEDLAQGARRVLHDLSIRNVGVEVADACLLDTVDCYDVVVVTASLPVYDPRYERALRPGGRALLVVGEAPVMQALRVTRTAGNEYLREPVFETNVPAMVGAKRPSRFNF